MGLILVVLLAVKIIEHQECFNFLLDKCFHLVYDDELWKIIPNAKILPTCATGGATNTNDND